VYLAYSLVSPSESGLRAASQDMRHGQVKCKILVCTERYSIVRLGVSHLVLSPA